LREAIGRLVGFALVRAIGWIDREVRGRSRDGGLLQYVCQFVRQQTLSSTGARVELSRAEHHMAAHRVGNRVQGLRGFTGSGIGMHAHLAEIVA
jgi:hypothetical protein